MRNYENTPRPNVEHHPHIRELIEVQEKRAADRTLFRERDKQAAERDSMINDAQMKCVVEFWCAKCKEDFKGAAIKQVEADWNNPAQRIAFYRMKCFEGHWCMRFVTDRARDPFFVRSRLLALDRANHYEDTIQPFQSGYDMLYSRKNT